MAIERTFVIADLAGYTAAVDVHGDDTAADLASVLDAAAVESLGPGDELVKSMGDAILAASATPASALAFLRGLFDRLTASSGVPLLRAGAHHGSAVRRDGDYFGSGVNVAARIADLAGGCQILGTRPIAEAARSQGIDVVDLGAFDLRNIAKPVVLYEIDCGHDARGHTIDPVCRMRVARDRAAGSLRHQGVEYWFCSLDCAGRFAAQPSLFAT